VAAVAEFTGSDEAGQAGADDDDVSLFSHCRILR
jgi:hypothetical protein